MKTYIKSMLVMLFGIMMATGLAACGGGSSGDDGNDPVTPPDGNGGSSTTVRVTCNYCQGSGKCYAYGTGCNGSGKCKKCNGTGQPSYYDKLTGKTTCSQCGGSGDCTTCHGSGLCTNCGGSGYTVTTTNGSGGGGSTTSDYVEIRVLKISATKLSSDYSYSNSTETMYKRTVDGTVRLYTRGKSLKGTARSNSDSKCGPYSVSTYSYRYMESSLSGFIYYYFN